MTLYDSITATWRKDDKEVEIDMNGIIKEAKKLRYKENIPYDKAIEVCMWLRFVKGRVK